MAEIPGRGVRVGAGLALTIGLVGLVSAILLAVGIGVVARRLTRPILALAGTASGSGR